MRVASVFTSSMRLDDLDAAGLAAAAGMDLRLHHPDRSGQFVGSLHRFIDGEGRDAASAPARRIRAAPPWPDIRGCSWTLRSQPSDVIAREGGQSSNQNAGGWLPLALTGCPACAGHDSVLTCSSPARCSCRHRPAAAPTAPTCRTFHARPMTVRSRPRARRPWRRSPPARRHTCPSRRIRH